MRIEKVKIGNFRSFGDPETSVMLDDFTIMIGPNNSGKTNLMLALSKLFGSTDQRIIHCRDFHVPLGEALETTDRREMHIEVILGVSNEKIDAPLFWNEFTVEEAGKKPYVRVRLESSWEKGTTPDGTVDSRMYFVTAPESEGEPPESKKPARTHDLSKINLLYVPATRDPSSLLRKASGNVLWRVLRYAEWNDDVRKKIDGHIEELNNALNEEKTIAQIQDILRMKWKGFHGEQKYSEAALTFARKDLDSLLNRLNVEFSPTDTGGTYDIEDLGDGMKSLFYLALVSTSLGVEQFIRESARSEDVPVLTLVAVEEPENHIAPQLMGRILDSLNEIASNDNAQVILSSHTPSILARIEPKQIRYFMNRGSTSVRAILLPDKEEEAHKFVNEAVKAFPELYFARLVVLAEGDSEQIILPKIFEMFSMQVDSHGISVVPLGGRHVNHFWKLLRNLDIKYVTLLDLDLERETGGWERIKYVVDQLCECEHTFERLKPCGVSIESPRDLLNKSNAERDLEEMRLWIDFLEEHDVFFSYPLDIDLLMLEKFPDCYKSIIHDREGPRIGRRKLSEVESESASTEYEDRLVKDLKAILRDESDRCSAYEGELRKLMPWYKYFFLGRSKPVSHIMALSRAEIDGKLIISNLPKLFERLTKKVRTKLEKRDV